MQLNTPHGIFSMFVALAVCRCCVETCSSLDDCSSPAP